jgi:hypothetical protein
MAHSFLRRVVFERRRTRVLDDGKELGREPLLERRERPVPRPKRLVRVPAVQLILEECLVMTGQPPGEFVFIVRFDQVHGVLLVDVGHGDVRNATWGRDRRR